MKRIAIFGLTAFLGLCANVYAGKPEINLYPNPATTYLNVILNEAAQTESVITVSDILGNKVQTFTFKPGEAMRIDLESLNLNQGVYLLHVRVNGAEFVKKFMLKNS